jgi:hypothetical protein
MIELSLLATPNQEFTCILEEQECTIQVRQIGDNVYFSLWLDSDAIVQNVICLPQVPILLNVPSEKFNGNFIMFDSTSPLSEQSKANYKEFGNRFKLYYLSQSEIEAS